MNVRFCPRCGSKVLPDATFCGNCGYRFGEKTINSRPYSRSEQPPLEPRQTPVYPSPVKHHYVRWILTGIALVAIGFGGYTWYQSSNNSGSSVVSSSSSDSGHSSRSSNLMPESTAKTFLSEMWSDVGDHIGDSTDGGDDFSQYFAGGSDNHDYHTLDKWTDDMEKSDGINSAEIIPKIESITRGPDGTSIVKYEAKYTFSRDSGDHKQGFMWTAKFRSGNGGWKIVTNKANNHPLYDND